MSVRIKPRCNGPVHLPVIRIGCNRRCVGTTTSINEATIWRVESSEGARIPLMPREVIFHWLETMIVRCIDSLFQTDVLVEGWEYEVRAERDDCYSFPASTKDSARRGLRSCPTHPMPGTEEIRVRQNGCSSHGNSSSVERWHLCSTHH
jgi:hypothetical protein